MKYMISIVLLLFGTNALAKEGVVVSGNDAKKIVLTGEVMGAHLMDERYSKELEVKGGTFFSVKSGGTIYNCFHAKPTGFVCQSLN